MVYNWFTLLFRLALWGGISPRMQMLRSKNAKDSKCIMLTWSLDPCQTMLRTSLERAKHQGVFFQICWQELPQNIRKNCETITGEALSATLQSKKKRVDSTYNVLVWHAYVSSKAPAWRVVECFTEQRCQFIKMLPTKAGSNFLRFAVQLRLFFDIETDLKGRCCKTIVSINNLKASFQYIEWHLEFRKDIGKKTSQKSTTLHQKNGAQHPIESINPWVGAERTSQVCRMTCPCS